MTMQGPPKSTFNHAEIRHWVAERGGEPARVSGTGDDVDAGVLRIAFSDDDKLEPIEWDEFFDKFEAQNMAFLYEETDPAGRPSRFFRLVDRDACARL